MDHHLPIYLNLRFCQKIVSYLPVYPYFGHRIGKFNNQVLLDIGFMKTCFSKKGHCSLIASLLFLFFAVGCGDGGKDDINNTTNQPDSMVIEIKGETGKSILELTCENYKVDYINSSMGVFVKAIDSTAATGKYAWLCSVNDSFVPVAVDAYITNDTDIIEWHYRKF